MRRLALAGALALLLASPLAAAAQAPVAVNAELASPVARIGEPVVLTLTLAAPADAEVEVDTSAPSWGEVRVLRERARESATVEGGVRHRIEVLVAPFAPDAITFVPALNIVTDAGSTAVRGPSLSLTVPSALAPGEPLTLSPPPPLALSPPLAGIGGAQSPLLWPAVGAGALAAVALVVGGGALGLRWWRMRPRAVGEPAPEAVPDPVADLDAAEALLDTDAAGAYRAIAGAVRRDLGERYAFPARSLATGELEPRMEAAGVDGWEARLARELLRECDAVVYAGYRPAPERRRADLAVARELVGRAP